MDLPAASLSCKTLRSEENWFPPGWSTAPITAGLCCVELCASLTPVRQGTGHDEITTALYHLPVLTGEDSSCVTTDIKPPHHPGGGGEASHWCPSVRSLSVCTDVTKAPIKTTTIINCVSKLAAAAPVTGYQNQERHDWLKPHPEVTF